MQITLLGEGCCLCQPPACSHDTSEVVACLLRMLGTVLGHQADRSTPPVPYVTTHYNYKYNPPPSTQPIG